MASNLNNNRFNYIERPSTSKEFCRLCTEEYKVYGKESKESRANLFNTKKPKKKKGKDNATQCSLRDRLRAVNLIVEEDPDLPSSICRSCESNVKTIEEAKKIKEKWVGLGLKRKLPEADEENEQQIVGAKKLKIANEKVSLRLY